MACLIPGSEPAVAQLVHSSAVRAQLAKLGKLKQVTDFNQSTLAMS